MGRSCPIYGTAIYLDCLDCDSKLCKSIKRKYSQVCIGIDQSYNNTGISIAADGELIKVKSVWLDKCGSNSERREKLRNDSGRCPWHHPAGKLQKNWRRGRQIPGQMEMCP